MHPCHTRRGLRLACLLAALACALPAAAFVGSLRGPKVDGELALPGLQQPVRVLRDEYGIPYLFAANTPDLIRAQGFVTAQDRLFQLEGYRAIATGRLAESVGEGGLASDRQIRLLGLRRNAERHAKLLSSEARDFLLWYAQGLNAYIEGHAGDHPLELKLAGFTPRPWTLEDMVTVLHFVNWSQAANFKAELTMQKLIDKFGADKALRELAPVNVNPDRTQQPVIVGDAAAARPLGEVQLLAGLGEPDAPLAPMAQLAPLAVGSNNWAIGKSRSASGAAVLVNDPHLDARMLPGIWHPVGLFAPGIQAVGAALPAVPGIQVGRTAHVAFGVTNAYGDSQDLFIEQVAPGQPDHYVDGAQVRPFQVYDEVIRIKDKDAPGGFREEKMTVRATVRGPVISGPILGYDGESLLSLRMASAELPGGAIGIDQLLKARSVADVDKAAQAMDVIYFNYVFADQAGGIGHRATGRVPVRASRQGRHPKPVGASDDWLGFIPPEQMPGTISPARDWVGSANHDNRPDGYPFDYSSYFASSYRIRRIAQVLEQAKGMRTADQSALMMDAHNLQAARVKPALVAALQDDPVNADLARILAAWDGTDDKNLAAPLIYHTLYERLVWETFVDEMGDKLARDWLGQWYMWQERFDELVRTPDSPWFDDIRTPQTETLPDLIKRVAPLVRAELQAKHGADPAQWKWGDEHRIFFFSPLRRSGTGRDFLGYAEAPMSGSGATLLRALTPFMGGFDVQFFASMRLVADLGDDDKIEAVVSGGVVDRQFHPHQKDQLPAWSEGRLLPWWFAPAQVEAHARQRQLLMPPK
ncbi:MAG TPA: penicillin acylase family protein [Rubrivivax sp.]|nr:penicillin acylase family protein [Rubrivivax sp.]HPO18009.1 penicillin acylase family protein [Rubrivivax sp.]